MTIMTGSVTRQ